MKMVLRDKDTQSISERPYHKRFLSHLTLLTPCLQSQSNVELNTRATGHLGHPVTAIDHLQHTLNVCFGMQCGV